MEIKYENHYNQDYWTGRKQYRDPAGNVQTYHGPSLDWEGFDFIADALAAVLPPRPQNQSTLLDIGCGGGALAKRMMQRGYDSYGVDISEYAINHCVDGMQGRLKLADITHNPSLTPLPTQYDLVMATDLVEHIYESDWTETFSWILSITKRWMFFCVATTVHPHGVFVESESFVAKKGETIPARWEQTAISGHVNVRPFIFWARRFAGYTALKIRWDLMYLFQAQREFIEPWKNTGGWNMQTTFFLERVF